jgi:hypothetical protein
MQVIARVAAIMGVTALAGGIPPAAAHNPAVALVLEVDGPVTPALRPYREILAGTTVSLTNEGRLVFLNYANCRTLTVVGGSVTFTSGPMPILKGAATRADVRGQCPRKFSATGSDAAVTMRDPSVNPSVTAVDTSTTPQFVLVGRRAEEFADIRITSGDRLLLARPLTGPRFLWPPGVPALAPGAYALDLRPKASGAAPVTVNFEASTHIPEAITLITID